MYIKCCEKSTKEHSFEPLLQIYDLGPQMNPLVTHQQLEIFMLEVYF